MPTEAPGRPAAAGLLVRVAEFLRAQTGWRKFLVAYLVGLVSSSAFPPYKIFAFLLVGYAVVLLLIDGARERPRPLQGAFWAGFSFGFGQFMGGLYWIAYAFLVDPSQHAWQIPFVVTLLPAGLAFFPGLAAAACIPFWRRHWSRIFVFTLFFSVAFYLRGHILTGFPWNLPAYGWGASLSILQSLSALGAYGLSLLTVLLGASLALLCDRSRRGMTIPLTLIGVFTVLWVLGRARLDLTRISDVPHVELRLVQPDVPQNQKYLPQYQQRNWQRLIDLSRRPAAVAPTDIIWPEAAPPFLLLRSPLALAQVAALTSHGRVLMTGAVRVTASVNKGYRFYNSVLIFAHRGQLIGVYDKAHLVPFGEYLPLRRILSAIGLTQLVDAPSNFTPGRGPRTYYIPGAPPVGPLICYEVIFPNAVVGAVRPAWFVNVTDDSWFGPPGSSGPVQHLLIARARAIEEGLPIARAANTGISAIIDPLGRITGRLGSGKLGVVDGPLPVALQPTIYARFGDSLFFVLLLGCAVPAVLTQVFCPDRDRKGSSR
jgi:apolipoprotein N-acyltransferase